MLEEDNAIAMSDDELAEQEMSELIRRRDPSKDPDFSTHCEFLTGVAGTGKSHEVMQRVKDDPYYGVLASTTGISAINMNVTTINSLLRYYDTESLDDMNINGSLTRRLGELGQSYRNLIIDEVSMMDGRQLDLIYNTLYDVYNTGGKVMGMVLTGDFAQLPPVKAKWAFEAECWPNFDRNTTRLTKIWRQVHPGFMDALRAAREGDGKRAVRLLQESGVIFQPRVDVKFDGTTIMSKNNEVERYNRQALLDLPGNNYSLRSKRAGLPRTEWKHIPEEFPLKLGAYVMILSNSDAKHIGPDYANGDCGWITEIKGGLVGIRLQRTEEVVWIGPITRKNTMRKPSDPEIAKAKALGYIPIEETIGRRKQWVLGEVTYYPIRLAYAATVHKTQGLSLDMIQVDCRNQFFGAPNMAYVALSRARTPEGVVIVGGPKTMEGRINTHPAVRRWL